MTQPPLDLLRPIFEEPPEGLDDGVPRFGHLIAAMGGMEGIEMARAFAVAGDRLLAAAADQGETWEAAHPILFCYRHTLELYLKALVEPGQRHHKLDALWQALLRRIDGRYSAGQIAWLGERITEFHSIDPGSTAFRFHDAHPQGIDPELWVDFHHLKRTTCTMFQALERIWLDLMSDRTGPTQMP